MKTIAALLLPLATLGAYAAPAQAAVVEKFDRAAFAQAKAQGRPVLVDVKAWWCPVCASQNRKIKRALQSPRYDKLTIFELNYDSQKDDWKALGVHKQGTLIGYRRNAEVGRLEFVTDEARIDDLLARTAG